VVADTPGHRISTLTQLRARDEFGANISPHNSVPFRAQFCSGSTPFVVSSGKFRQAATGVARAGAGALFEIYRNNSTSGVDAGQAVTIWV